jgi:hypothetical protein
MNESFTKYSVNKRDKRFSLPGGEVLPQTAIVSFLRENDEIISTLELGVIDAEYLYEQIADDQIVNLDKCYIENFSLATFRKERNFKQNQLLDVSKVIITNSVFYSKSEIDFSYVRFKSGELDLSNSIFIQGGINFDHCHFGDGTFIFDSTYFHEGCAIFSNAQFGKGLLSFKNSKFYKLEKRLQLEGKKSKNNRKNNRGILNFESASFSDGKIDFTRSQLGSGDITFSNAILKKRDLLFIGAEFNKVRFNFKSVHFSDGKLDFHFANFKQGSLFFDRTSFNNGIIDFSATEAGSGKISFNRTKFEKNELIFESSEFGKGDIIFKNNYFGAGILNFNSLHFRNSNILFENVDFGKCTASFLKARIKELTFRSCHLNAYFDLQVRQCESLDFSNTVVRDIVDIKTYGFSTDIQSLNLSGLHLLGHFYIDWKANRVKDLIMKQKTTHRNRSEQFRILKENYHSLGQYHAEDEAYVEFRRAEAKADLKEALANGNFLERMKASASHGFKWLVFDKIGLYATSPVRVLISMGFVYLTFVLIYFLLPYVVDSEILPSLDHGETISPLGKAFYHSIITFLTIGYGDYYPMGIFRWISGFEGFMGLFLISYFTVAFVRKVLR